MAILIVNTLTDVVDANDGKLSLREAVAQANGTVAADTILFASALEGQTLTLTGGELVLRQDATIDGDSDNNGTRVTLDGDDSSRIFRVQSEVSISDLTLVNGQGSGGDGGAILLGAYNTLTVNNCTIKDNECGEFGYYGGGGAISAGMGARLIVRNTTISDNDALGGGGILADVGSIVII